jgi:hypothetical protein
MRTRISTAMVVMVALGLLIGCAALGLDMPGSGKAKSAVTEAATEASVVVLDSKVEKLEPYKSVMGDTGYAVKITGTAKYSPAAVGAEPFAVACKGTYLVFDIFDADGKKLPEILEVRWDACGEYGNPENVVADEPFPFECKCILGADAEGRAKAIYESIADHKFSMWRQ